MPPLTPRRTRLPTSVLRSSISGLVLIMPRVAGQVGPRTYPKFDTEIPTLRGKEYKRGRHPNMAETGGFPRRFDQYVLLKPLARGGMGELYLAVSGSRGMEKLCVIKTVLPNLVTADNAKRFRDEAM